MSNKIKINLQAGIKPVIKTLPDFLGGGSFFSIPGRPQDPAVTERDVSASLKERLRGGSFKETGLEVDHITPKALGGTDELRNLETKKSPESFFQRIKSFFTKKKAPLAERPFEKRQEGKVEIELQAIREFREGKIDLPQARLKVATAQQRTEDKLDLDTSFFGASPKTFFGEVFGVAKKALEKKTEFNRKTLTETLKFGFRAIQGAYNLAEESISKTFFRKETPEGTLRFEIIDEQTKKMVINHMMRKTPVNNFFTDIGNAYSKGKLEAKKDILTWDAVVSDEDIYAEVKKKKDKVSERIDLTKARKRNFLQDNILKAVGLAPQIVTGRAQGEMVGLIFGAGAIVVGQLGPQAATSEEVVTVPAAHKLGRTIGAFQYWYRQGAGAMYSELRDAGIGHDQAKAMSLVTAVPYAVIEFSQVEKIIPGFGELLRTAIRQIAQKNFGALVKRHGLRWLTEVGEEGLQEALQATNLEVAKWMDDKVEGNTVATALWNIAKRTMTAIKESAIPMLLLMSPNIAIEVAGGIDTEKLKKIKPGLTIEEVGEEEIKPLIEEAKKFKSAEEFIESKETFFHGTNDKNALKIEDEGFKLGQKPKTDIEFPGGNEFISITKKKNEAEVFGKTILNVKLSPNINEASIEKFNELSKKLGNEKLAYRELVKQGFDAIDFSDSFSRELRIINPKVIKTDKQLTDIFNQAKQIEPKFKIKIPKRDVVFLRAEEIPIEEAKKKISEIFDKDEVEFMGMKKLAGQVQGRYIQSLIQVLETDGKVKDTVVYHETFHAYFDLFVDKVRKKEILGIIDKEFSSDVNEIMALSEEQKRGLSKEGASEEVIADKFALYLQSKDNIKNKTLTDFFKDIIKKIQGFVTGLNKIEGLFKDITEKKRPIKKISERKERNKIPMNKIKEDNSKYYEEVQKKGRENISPETEQDIFNSPLKIKFKKEGSFFFPGEEIKSPADVAFAFKQLKNEAVEKFYVVGVKNNRPIAVEPIGLGTLNASLIHPREALSLAIKKKADTVYYIHNHPSGSVDPSEADVQVSERMKDVSKKLNIKFGGHVIINTHKFGIIDENLNVSIEEQKELKGKPVEVSSYKKYIEWVGEKKPAGPMILSSNNVFSLIKGLNIDKEKNSIALYLNARSQVITAEAFPKNKIKSSTLFKNAVNYNSASIIIGNFDFNKNINDANKIKFDLNRAGIEVMDFISFDINSDGEIDSFESATDVMPDLGKHEDAVVLDRVRDEPKIRPEIQKKIDETVKEDNDLTKREIELFTASEPYPDGEMESQYQSFKKALKTTSTAILQEIEDVEQFKEKLGGKKVTTIKTKVTKDEKGKKIVTKTKSEIIITNTKIDNMLHSREVSDNDMFTLFKERIQEERENRGLKMKMKQDRKELEDSIKRVQKQIELEEERGRPIPEAELIGYEHGYLEARRDYQNKMNRRRYQLRIVKDYFKLSDADARTISKKDIRYMSDPEFNEFLNAFSDKAMIVSQKKEAKQSLLSHIIDLDLQKTDNLREAMKLPPINQMTIDQLDKFHEAILPFQMGDEFLTVRKLETIKNTELDGVKTVREVREDLIKKIGPENLNVNVGVFDKFRYDTDLAEKHPFYNLMITETLKAELKAENAYLQMERKVEVLTRKSRKAVREQKVDKKTIGQVKGEIIDQAEYDEKFDDYINRQKEILKNNISVAREQGQKIPKLESKNKLEMQFAENLIFRGITNFRKKNGVIVNLRKKLKKGLGLELLIAQDRRVFEWLSATPEDKVDIAEQMTKEEMDLAYFIQEAYRKMRDILVERQVLDKYRENYITNIQRPFWEAVKDDGFLTAIKEARDIDRRQQAYFEIISDTGEILPLEKFFQFSLQRTGKVPATKNVARAFLAYLKAFSRKDFFDSVIPMLDSYVFAIQDRTKVTPRGIELDKALKNFFNDWMNTKKGRTKKLFLVDQGDKIDTVLRVGQAFITMADLGLNIPVGLASNVGETMMNFINMGPINQAKAQKRKIIDRKKAKRFLKKYENFTGRGVWDEMTEVSKDIGDRLTLGIFSLFKSGNVRASKTYLLGSITDEEWKNEEVSAERLTQMKKDMGRWRAVPGAESIVGATTPGKIMTKYKTWAVPILRTTKKNIEEMLGMMKGGKNPVGSKQFWELLRASLVPLTIYALFSTIDDDDDSFISELLAKIRREILSSIGALSPKMWLAQPRLWSFISDLGVGVTQLILLERYKRDPKSLKGTATLKEAVTPRAVKQAVKFILEKKEKELAPGKVKINLQGGGKIKLGKVKIKFPK